MRGCVTKFVELFECCLLVLRPLMAVCRRLSYNHDFCEPGNGL